MENFCFPFDSNPITDKFISVCLTDTITFVVNAVILLFLGSYRLSRVRKLKSKVRPYSKAHVFELVMHVILVLCAGSNFIYLFVIKNGDIPEFKYLMTIAWALLWGCALFLCEYEYQRGVKHNWVLISSWVWSATFEGLRLQALYFEDKLFDELGSFWFILVELIASCLLAFNVLLNNSPPPEPGDEKEHKLHDEKTSLLLEKRDNIDGKVPVTLGKPECGIENKVNIISRLTFQWITPLLRKGFYMALVHDDLPPCLEEDTVHNVAERFEVMWDVQTQTGKVSLVGALWRTFWKEFCIGALFKLGNDAFIFSGPIILEYLITFIGDLDQPVYIGILLAVGMFLGSTLQSLFMQQYWQIVYRVSMKTKAALIAKIYSKSLKISHKERQKSTVGQITNLQSVDAGTIAGIAVFLHQLWSAPLQILISIGLLWNVLQEASLGGLAVLAISSPLQIWVGRLLAKNQKEMMQKKDERIKSTNEVLQGIRLIKFFAWESSFMNKISNLRWAELLVLRYGAFVRAAVSLIWTLTPLVVTLVSFGIFVALNKTLTPAIAFTALSLFNVMRFPLNIFPSLITQLIEAQVSLQRLEKFFQGEELPIDAVEEDLHSDYAVEIRKSDFEWSDGRKTLKDVTLRVPKGSLFAVVGEVGSGKSSLLSAILGEIPQISGGKIVVNGTTAYVPQNAWIKNATVKENVIFLNESDENRYQYVVKAAQLLPDLEILPARDNTEIGEKGINLSGGQKQRVSMARAVYSDADIYLLDDPLSAVDAHVGKALFTECIQGALAKKTRILVTHQLQYLNLVDYIVVFKDGSIIEEGTYDELMNQGHGFAQLVNDHVGEDMMQSVDKGKEADKKPDAAPAKPQGKPGGGPPGAGTLIGAEGRDAGGVRGDVYWSYIVAIGGLLMAFGILFLYVLQTAASLVGDYWLSYWSVMDEKRTENIVNMTTFFFYNDMNYHYSTSRKLTQIGFGEQPFYDLGLGIYFYLVVYAIIGIITAVMILARSFILAQAGVNASRKIHGDMLARVLRAPVSYFDTVPVGRILNRFSSDQNVIDNALPRTLGMAFDTVLTSLSVIFVIGSVTPVFLVALISLSFLYRYAQKYYLRSSREIQRLLSIARSPIYALFGETLNGLSTIRAFGKQLAFQEQNEVRVQKANEAEYAGFTANRWLGIRLEFFGSVVVFASSFFAVLSRQNIDPGLAGLSVSYALRLTSNLNWLVRMSTDVENNLISVERCIQFTELNTEASPTSPNPPPPNWPQYGGIQFKNLRMKYRENLPEVLKGINCTIKPKEKIGIVGRTGSGKSSLMLALFRIVEPTSGNIVIDDIDIHKIGLEELRSKLAIIPQDPTLFTGTIRTNLDPFEIYEDHQIWNALEAVELKEMVRGMEGNLEHAVSEYGENLSVGTRQLLCLARALLRQSNILIMDEATANVDYKNDALIQKAIRKVFSETTVLTIAHRINTIMDYDKVMVLNEGEILEFDSPSELMKREDSVFYSLAKQSGIKNKEEQEVSIFDNV